MGNMTLEHWSFFTKRVDKVNSKEGRTVYLKKNSSHFWAWCKYCLTAKVESLKRETPDKDQEWYREEAFEYVVGIAGVKDQMETHLKYCQHIPLAERQNILKAAQSQSPSTIPAIRKQHPNHSDNSSPQSIKRLAVARKHDTPLAISLNADGDGVSASDKQRKFEREILKLIAGTGYTVVLTSHFRELFSVVSPQLKFPTPERLLGVRLDEACNDIVAQLVEKVGNRMATVSSAGWSNVSTSNLMAYMVNVQSMIVKSGVLDTEGRDPDDATCVRYMKFQIKKAEEIFGVDVVAVCTDSSDSDACLRRLLPKEAGYSHIPVVPCMANQTQLICLDAMRASAGMSEIVKLMVEIPTYIYGNSGIMELMTDVQKREENEATLINAIPNRWSSYFLLSQRLLDLEMVLKITLLKWKAKIGAEDQEQSEPMKRVITNLDNSVFWNKIREFNRFLKPLAIASAILDRKHVGPDTVFYIFASLWSKYAMFYDEGDASTKLVTKRVLESIEMRWRNLDHRIFLCAFLLNPFLGRNINFFKPGSIIHNPDTIPEMLKNLYIELFREPAPESLPSEWSDYINNKGKYGSANMLQDEIRRIGRARQTEPNPLSCWSVSVVDESSPMIRTDTAPLPRLATRLLSIIPRSASLKNQLLALKNLKQNGILPLKKMGQLAFLNNVSTSSHVFPISASDELDSMPTMEEFLTSTGPNSFDTIFTLDAMVNNIIEENNNVETNFKFEDILTRMTANPEFFNLGALTEELLFLEEISNERIQRSGQGNIS